MTCQKKGFYKHSFNYMQLRACIFAPHIPILLSIIPLTIALIFTASSTSNTSRVSSLSSNNWSDLYKEFSSLLTAVHRARHLSSTPSEIAIADLFLTSLSPFFLSNILTFLQLLPAIVLTLLLKR